MKEIEVNLTINHKKVSRTVPANWRLLDLLREGFSLTGCKEGCGVGECGACTVLLAGEPVNSCLVLVGQAEGKEVLTIEGLTAANKEEELHPLQQAFIEKGAIQCGYCTPGMVLSSLALLRRNAEPGVKEIKEAISGNLCRCTGYKQIVEAVQLAADWLKEDGDYIE